MSEHTEWNESLEREAHEESNAINNNCPNCGARLVTEESNSADGRWRERLVCPVCKTCIKETYEL